MYKWGSEDWQNNHISSEEAMKSQVLHTMWLHFCWVSRGNLKLILIDSQSPEWRVRAVPRHRPTGLTWHDLTLSLPSSKSTFFQSFQEKCISDAVRIGRIIIFDFHMSKLWKAKFSTLCGYNYFCWGSERNLKLILIDPQSQEWRVRAALRHRPTGLT